MLFDNKMDLKLLLNPRMKLLYQQAYDEEAKSIPTDLDENITPVSIIYPRSFVEKIRSFHKNETEKSGDYNFIGTYFRKRVSKKRKWIFPFIKAKFTKKFL